MTEVIKLFTGFTNFEVILAGNTERLYHAVYSVAHVELKKNEQKIYIKLYFTLMRTDRKYINLEV